MSDDFDDSFIVDDSFLREVDNIAAKASSRCADPSRPAHSAITHTLSLQTAGNSNVSTGPQRSSSTGQNFRANPTAGPSRPPIAKSRIHPPPSSDDYDDLPIPAESFAALDSLASRPPSKTIPSSNLGRTSSGNESFLQTHLDFRREKQSTKGKRWDRTAFAESGRRIGAEKAIAKDKGRPKAKGRGFDGDDDEENIEEEEDWGEALAPYPKPFVDPSKSG